MIAAIGIWGPVDRLKSRVAKQFAPAVVEVARSISSRLGWTGGASA